MEEEIPYRFIAAVVVMAVVVGGVVYLLFGTPLYPRIPLSPMEGFVSGGVRLETGELLAFLEEAEARGKGKGRQGKKGSVHAEFELLLQKMAALVADLTSTDRRVNQTRHLPFETAHDRMVVGEICGMCLQQTLSARDVDLFLEAWRARGSLLLRKRCTVDDLSESDAVMAESLFSRIWTQVHEVATQQCVASLPSATRGARDAAPFEPGPLRTTGTYDFTYGGLSASGWNGSV